MTAPSWAGPYRTVDGRDEVLVPCDSCGGPVFESCRTRWRARGQLDCGLSCEPRRAVGEDVRVHWVPQGIVTGAEVVTAEEYVAIAGPLDPEFDWPVPVASRGGVALYLRPQLKLSAAGWHRQLLVELTEGRPVRLGRLTVTQSDDGGLTFTGPAGGSSTFRTVEEFEEALVEAHRLVSDRKSPARPDDEKGVHTVDTPGDAEEDVELSADGATIAVVPGLPRSFAWWHEDQHLAIRACSKHDLPGALEAAAQHIRARNGEG